MIWRWFSNWKHVEIIAQKTDRIRTLRPSDPDPVFQYSVFLLRAYCSFSLLLKFKTSTVRFSIRSFRKFSKTFVQRFRCFFFFYYCFVICILNWMPNKSEWYARRDGRFRMYCALELFVLRTTRVYKISGSGATRPRGCFFFSKITKSRRFYERGKRTYLTIGV